MAKVTMVFEDKLDGKVSVTADPSFETMVQMELSGHALSSAHGYAILAINAIRKSSQKEKPKSIIEVSQG